MINIMDFQEMKARNILVISVLWSYACEYGDDELYEGVKKLMEKQIFAETLQCFEEVETEIARVRAQLHVDIKNLSDKMVHNWKMRKFLN